MLKNFSSSYQLDNSCDLSSSSTTEFGCDEFSTRIHVATVIGDTTNKSYSNQNYNCQNYNPARNWFYWTMLIAEIPFFHFVVVFFMYFIRTPRSPLFWMTLFPVRVFYFIKGTFCVNRSSILKRKNTNMIVGSSTWQTIRPSYHKYDHKQGY